MKNLPPRFILLTKTATADTAFKLTVTELWLEYADIFVTTNSAYIGDTSGQTAAIYANDVLTIPYPVDINNLLFKNLTGGSNAVVTIIGTTLTQKKANEYGIVIPD